MPSVPIHSLWNWIALRHLYHIPIIFMPTTIIVHMSNYRGNIFDDACFLPCFELEIVGFGMSLITYLSGNLWMTLGHLNQQLTFLESPNQGFLTINMLSIFHCHHCDKEMDMIRYTCSNCIEVIGIFFKELTEIGKTFSIRVHVEYLLTLFSIKVNIT